MGAPGPHGPVGPTGKHGNRGEPVSCKYQFLNAVIFIGFTSDCPTLGNLRGAGEDNLGHADNLCFSFPIHRVLLVLLVPPVPLVQEVLVYVPSEDFFTNEHLREI